MDEPLGNGRRQRVSQHNGLLTRSLPEKGSPPDRKLASPDFAPSDSHQCGDRPAGRVVISASHTSSPRLGRDAMVSALRPCLAIRPTRFSSVSTRAQPVPAARRNDISASRRATSTAEDGRESRSACAIEPRNPRSTSRARHSHDILARAISPKVKPGSGADGDFAGESAASRFRRTLRSRPVESLV